MADAIAALIELAVGIVQLLIHLLLWLLSLVGIRILRLENESDDRQPRFETTRLLTALASVAIVVAAIVGGVAWVRWRASVHQAMQKETRQLVEEQADRLAEQATEDGRFERHKADTLDQTDAWGNRLHVDYQESLLQETLTVRSSGGDGKLGTEDDLSTSRSKLRPKGQIAKDAFGKAKDAIKKRFQGKGVIDREENDGGEEGERKSDEEVDLQ